MRIVRAHGMTKQEAIDWIESHLPEMLNQFGAHIISHSHSWRDSVMDLSLSLNLIGRFRGRLEVTDIHYILDVPFGLLQRVFEAKAKAAIEQWLDDNLPVGASI